MNRAHARTWWWLGAALSLLLAARSHALEVRQVNRDALDFIVVELDLDHDRLELHWQDDAGQALSSIEGLRAWGRGQGRT